MGPVYTLELLTGKEAARWDELIAPYARRGLFHRKVWLDYLAASRGVEIRMWAIRLGNETAGYFCGGLLRKGPFRILASPLRGWGTNYMGPVVGSNFVAASFLKALDELAAQERLAMIEMESPLLPDGMMSRFGYEPALQPTYVVELTPGEPENMWKRLAQREEVRKAIRSGLTAEDTNDPEIAEEFYDQFVEVLARKNLFPPYDRNCPRLLFQYLKARDLLFALRVREPGGRIVATGLFPHDDGTVYFWGGASRMIAWRRAPNDFLQWSVMEMAAKRGLISYNMCGYGFFKRKFGGILETPNRWHKCFSRAAKWGRRGYEFYFRNRIRCRGWWERVTHRRHAI